ncbi:uncharacterized protein LOC107044138 [Diachasma alloeum]|uniref:uncharacterized protein LOC107044138 n=1 Tax=Diachasma alloeum TaxID=454923 RepID=UPI000738164B|nr:uncharacterized protein LOC107044138 [Diachasma alloeum]
MKGKNTQSRRILDTARVRTITDKRKTLERNSAEIRSIVSKCFNQLSNSLKIREKQLLRQIEVIHNQQLCIIQSNWELLPSVPSININLDNWQYLESSILKLGRLELPDKDGLVVKDVEPYKVEEYEETNKDHVSFDKSIKLENRSESIVSLCREMNFSTYWNYIDSPTRSVSPDFDVGLDAATIVEKKVKKKEKMENNNFSPTCSPVLASQSNMTTNSKDISKLKSSNIIWHLTDSSPHPCDQQTIEETILDSDVSSNSGKEEANILGTSDIDKGEKHTEIPFDRDPKKSVEIPNNSVNIERDQHPKQIQQWLQQILVETETEPVIDEIEPFAKISKSRF